MSNKSPVQVVETPGGVDVKNDVAGLLLLDDVHKKMNDSSSVVVPRVTSYGMINRDVTDGLSPPEEDPFIIVDRSKKKKKTNVAQNKKKKKGKKSADMNETTIEEGDLHVRSPYGDVVDAGMYVPSVPVGTNREDVFNDYLEGKIAFAKRFKGAEQLAWKDYAFDRRKLLKESDVAEFNELRLQQIPPSGKRMKYVAKLYSGEDNVVLRSGREVPKNINSSTDTEGTNRESLLDVTPELSIRDVSSVSLPDQISAVEGMKRMDRYSEGPSDIHDRAYDDAKMDVTPKSTSFLKTITGTFTKLIGGESNLIEMEDLGDPGSTPHPLNPLVLPVAEPKEKIVTDVPVNKLPKIYDYPGKSLEGKKSRGKRAKPEDSTLIPDNSEKNPTDLYQTRNLRESRKLDMQERSFMEGVNNITGTVSDFAKNVYRKVNGDGTVDNVDFPLASPEVYLPSPTTPADFPLVTDPEERKRRFTARAEAERLRELRRMEELNGPERVSSSTASLSSYQVSRNERVAEPDYKKRTELQQKKDKGRKKGAKRKSFESVEIEMNPLSSSEKKPEGESSVFEKLKKKYRGDNVPGVVVGDKIPEDDVIESSYSFGNVAKTVGKVALGAGAVGAGVMMLPAVLPAAAGVSAVAGTGAIGATVLGLGAGATGVGVYNREKVGETAKKIGDYVKSAFVTPEEKPHPSERLSDVVKVPEESGGIVDGAYRLGGYLKSALSTEQLEKGKPKESSTLSSSSLQPETIEVPVERTGFLEGAKRVGGFVKSKFSTVSKSDDNPLEEITEESPLEHRTVPRESLWATVKNYGSHIIPDGGEVHLLDTEKEEQEKVDHDMALEYDRRNRDELMEDERTSSVPSGTIADRNVENVSRPRYRSSRARSYSPSARVYDKRPMNTVEGASANKRRKVADSDYVPRGKNVGADPDKVRIAEEGLKKEGGVNDLMMMMMMMQQIQSSMHYPSDRGMADSYVPTQLSSYRMHSSDLTV